MSRGTNQDDKLSTFILSSSWNFTSFLNIITEVSETHSNVRISKGKGHTAVLRKNYPPDDLLIRQ